MRLPKDLTALPPLARRLATERGRRGLNQTQMGALLETSQSLYAKWESGKVLPSVPNLKRIVRILDWKVNDSFWRGLEKLARPPERPTVERKRRRPA